jgi:hypothetical protein
MDNELRFLLEQGPTSVKELARLTGKSTSTIYKALGSDPDVIKDNTGTGVGTLFSLPPSAAPVNVPPSATPPESSVSPAPEEKVAPAPSKRGRKASFAGKQLYPDASLLGSNDNEAEGHTPTYQNPRRKTSAGYRSLQIILDHPGITSEDYVTKGGRLNDLRWDVDHGHVRAE